MPSLRNSETRRIVAPIQDAAPAWRPLLVADEAREAERMVDEIATRLSLPADATTELRLDTESPSLAVGQCGLALFHAYRHLELRTPGADELAERHLEKAIDGTLEMPLPANLYGGISGVGWSLQHISQRLSPTEVLADDDANSDVDEVLEQHLETHPWTGDYDLVSGLVGLGVYALERLPRPSARRQLEHIVSHLDSWSHVTPDGITWPTPPQLLWQDTAALFPGGCFNIGLAHGIPGILALLGRICEAGAENGFDTSRAHALLDGGVRWLLAHRLDDSSASTFPDMIDASAARTSALAEAQPARLAWCYGDAGVATALYGAASRVYREDWQLAAMTIAKRAVRRSLESTRIRDAAICHGSAGLAHLCNRLYQATGDAELGDAARRWLRVTLDYFDPQMQHAGFVHLEPREPGGTHGPSPRLGLLTGSSGIGLVLLAALGNTPPLWDRVLQVDLPSHGPRITGVTS